MGCCFLPGTVGMQPGPDSELGVPDEAISPPWYPQQMPSSNLRAGISAVGLFAPAFGLSLLSPVFGPVRTSLLRSAVLCALSLDWHQELPT